MCSKILILTLIFLSVEGRVQTSTKCQNNLSRKTVQLIVNYADWRHIKHVVILQENIKLGCNLRTLKSNLKKFTDNNIYLSIRSSTNSLFNIQQVNYKIVAVTFYKNHSREEFTEQANKLTLYGETISWLIILTSDQEHILDYLRFANFGLDADVVIAVDTTWTRPVARPQGPNSTNKENDATNTYNEINLFVPFLGNENLSSYSLRKFCQNGSVVIYDAYCMVQIYKIRKLCNTSLVVYPLGIWHTESGTQHMKPFLNTEKRNNFFQFPLIFGQKNSSQNIGSENVIEDDDDNDESNMREFMTYFAMMLNSSETTTTYSQLGFKNSDGEWTDLFGAIVSEEVDLGANTIIKTPQRCSDMTFTYNIMESMRNIYIQPQESNQLRDIFLAPFGSRLILCVAATGAVLTVVMIIYSNITEKCGMKKAANARTGFLDAIIWCFGIFSQQGSIWKPRSCSERIIIIVSLAFTLLIYNSYSAFITSVLSVKRWNIRTVDDLLNSGYEIGYTKNSQDETYLRSMNITQLNQIYLRGYLHNNISNVTEGLVKATKGNYGFFASRHIARKELLIISNYKCRHDISEIRIDYTANYIAFPMPKRSPYKKLINLRKYADRGYSYSREYIHIIKMYESGVYKYIYALLNPSLKKCENPRTYQSARLPDLITPFGLLVVGQIVGVVIGIIECIWKRKKKIYKSVRKNVTHRPAVRRHL